jgi:Protein of unknown function (DUF4231)
LNSVSHSGTDSFAHLVPGGDIPGGDNQAVDVRLGGQGRIQFDFRIGITGHRRLDDPDALVPAIREALRLLRDLLPEHADSYVVLVVVSSLAEGADRLVARELLAEPRSRLEAILPVARSAYAEDFQDATSRKEFRNLLARASQVRQAPGRSTRQEAYEWAGRRVVDRCDALIAVWDGQSARGRGGTQQIVEYARDHDVPLAWVHASGDPQVSAELHHESEGVHAMREAMRDLREYNEREVAAAQFQARIEAQRDDLWLAAVPTPSADTLGQAREDVAAWLVPFLARADLLAVRVHRRFRNLSTAMFAMAAAAVAVVAVQTNFFPSQDWLVSLEILLLVVLLAIPLLRNRMRLHERWTSYRFLAERLRSAYFLTLAGTGDRRQQTDPSASFSDPTVAWIERALSQVMASRPRVALTSSDVMPLRTYLSNCWIGGQAKYHYATARKSGRWELWLRRATACLFGITLISAVLHAIGLGPKLHLAAGLVVVSLSVPAAGAALHGIGTQHEYRRHAQRCRRMVTQLTQLQYQMNEAESLTEIRHIAANVERSMREESNDWFGVMRFHDIELIT